MEAAMRRTGGVGIAAPQVGLSIRLVVLLLDWKTERPRVLHALDPVVTERSDDVQDSWEGCLSVPGKGGLVRRTRQVTVAFRDPATGEARTESAEGPNAVVWQHELDHLDGVLYVDRLAGDLLPIEEMRRRREEAGRHR
jgi:peptide deformylase